MTIKCKCGGKLRRTDIVGAYDAFYKRVMYSDTDPIQANWKCDKCGAVRTQRKRQPADKSLRALARIGITQDDINKVK